MRSAPWSRRGPGKVRSTCPVASASGVPKESCPAPADNLRDVADDVPPEIEKVLISEEEIRAKVTELAAEIDRDYSGREVLLVGVLKGAVMIMADLARAMQTPVS